jgi:hypothetical protein
MVSSSKIAESRLKTRLTLLFNPNSLHVKSQPGFPFFVHNHDFRINEPGALIRPAQVKNQ